LWKIFWEVIRTYFGRNLEWWQFYTVNNFKYKYVTKFNLIHLAYFE
jgi:hypothetical protein